MIEYRLFTKPELLEWHNSNASDQQPPHSGENGLPQDRIPKVGAQQQYSAALEGPHCIQEIDDETVCAICAFDAQRLIGRISILYFDLLINNQRLRCAVGSGFRVLNEYRRSAVGLSVLLKAMNLGVPYFEAGVSGQMRAMLLRMKQFHLVDDSPLFQVGLDNAGCIQIAKWDHFKSNGHEAFIPEQLTKLKHLARNWRYNRTLLKSERAARFPPDTIDVTKVLADIAIPQFPIQIPWNRDFLIKGLSGKEPKFAAWLIGFADAPSRTWLVSLYRRDRVLGQGPKGEPKILREAHLNEIYPPLGGDDPILPLLAFASRKATAIGASVLHIHALTKSIVNACHSLGLRCHTSKTIFVAPGKIEPKIHQLFVDPANWWCRAFTEDEMEEAFDSGNGPDELFP